MRFLNPNLRKPVEPDMENVLLIPDYYGNIHIITPQANRDSFDITKAMLKATEKSKGYVEKMYNPENGYVGFHIFENKEAYDENTINMFANKMQMGMTIKTKLLEGYSNMTVIYDGDATKKLHYDVLTEMFEFYFEKDHQKALGELEKLFVAEKSSAKYFRNFTFNNRHVRFEKYQNDSGFQFFISTKGYRP